LLAVNSYLRVNSASKILKVIAKTICLLKSMKWWCPLGKFSVKGKLRAQTISSQTLLTPFCLSLCFLLKSLKFSNSSINLLSCHCRSHQSQSSKRLKSFKTGKFLWTTIIPYNLTNFLSSTNPLRKEMRHPHLKTITNPKY
jgi:hypothetical protein